MSTQPATPLEVVSDEQSELAVIVRQNALPAEAAQGLQASFAPAFTEARTILQQSRQIVVTDASQKLQIKLAREYRLALKNVRVGADKTRKELKDESVRKGRAIDGFFNILLHITESEETRLQQQEDFAKVQEEARKAALKVAREAICQPLGIDPNLYQLAEMSEETFQTLVEGTKLARAAQEAARVKAEADRIAKEAADAAERERVRLENERLKREADEREAAAKIERERVAREKADAEEALRLERERVAKEKADAEAAAQVAQAKAEAALREQKRLADEAAAQERIEFARKQEEIAEANRKEQLRLQALRDIERQKAETAAAEAKAKADAALKAQQEKARKEREAAEAKARAEKEAADKENARLLEIERKKAADAAEVARKEREAREAAEMAEAARLAREEEARRKAAAAPDAQKLLVCAEQLRAFPIPAVSSGEANDVSNLLAIKIGAVAEWLKQEAGKL